MMKLLQIFALGLVSLTATAGLARAERSLHDGVIEQGVISSPAHGSIFLAAQDRPPLDGVISQLEGRYGPGQVKSVSDTFVGRDGQDYFTVKYLTNDGQMIIVRVDANSGRIVGGS